MHVKSLAARYEAAINPVYHHPPSPFHLKRTRHLVPDPYLEPEEESDDLHHHPAVDDIDDSSSFPHISTTTLDSTAENRNEATSSPNFASLLQTHSGRVVAAARRGNVSFMRRRIEAALVMEVDFDASEDNTSIEGHHVDTSSMMPPPPPSSTSTVSASSSSSSSLTSSPRMASLQSASAVVADDDPPAEPDDSFTTVRDESEDNTTTAHTEAEDTQIQALDLSAERHTSNHLSQVNDHIIEVEDVIIDEDDDDDSATVITVRSLWFRSDHHSHHVIGADALHDDDIVWHRDGTTTTLQRRRSRRLREGDIDDDESTVIQLGDDDDNDDDGFQDGGVDMERLLTDLGDAFAFHAATVAANCTDTGRPHSHNPMSPTLPDLSPKRTTSTAEQDTSPSLQHRFDIDLNNLNTQESHRDAGHSAYALSPMSSNWPTPQPRRPDAVHQPTMPHSHGTTRRLPKAKVMLARRRRPSDAATVTSLTGAGETATDGSTQASSARRLVREYSDPRELITGYVSMVVPFDDDMPPAAADDDEHDEGTLGEGDIVTDTSTPTGAAATGGERTNVRRNPASRHSTPDSRAAAAERRARLEAFHHACTERARPGKRMLDEGEEEDAMLRDYSDTTGSSKQRYRYRQSSRRRNMLMAGHGSVVNSPSPAAVASAQQQAQQRMRRHASTHDDGMYGGYDADKDDGDALAAGMRGDDQDMVVSMWGKRRRTKTRDTTRRPGGDGVAAATGGSTKVLGTGARIVSGTLERMSMAADPWIDFITDGAAAGVHADVDLEPSSRSKRRLRKAFNRIFGRRSTQQFCTKLIRQDNDS